jgi:hypothetical protein
MSYRIPSPILYIAPKATIRVGFGWSKPGDAGAVWAMAHPIRGEPRSPLATERVAKLVDCEIAKVVAGVPPKYYSCGDPNTAFWLYYADITNDGNQGCRFQLDVGGV